MHDSNIDPDAMPAHNEPGEVSDENVEERDSNPADFTEVLEDDGNAEENTETEVVTDEEE